MVEIGRSVNRYGSYPQIGRPGGSVGVKSSRIERMDHPRQLLGAATRRGRTRQEIARAAQAEHARRHQLAGRIAQDHGGVVTLQMLLAEGLTRGQIATEIERGAWHRAGYRTLSITSREPVGEGLWYRALWESGERAALDGVTALLAAGLKGWREDIIDVSVPNDAKVRAIPGVRHHLLRDLGTLTGTGLRRTRPEVAAIRAAQWARSNRASATLLAMTIQQRLTSPELLLGSWASVTSSPRRAFLDRILRDICDGAHSLSELDFAEMCRDHGMPEPTRQALRMGDNGRVYLDILWEGLGVHVEIQGAQHGEGTAGIDDALRVNGLQLGEEDLISLQIPVLGLRLEAGKFLDQVRLALVIAEKRKQAA